MTVNARASAPAWTRIPGKVHRAAITGKLVDAETGVAVEGARVELVSMPAPFQRWLSTRAIAYGAAQWESLPERPDRTSTAADGCFRFIDLPEGAYRLSVSPPGGSRCYGSVAEDLTLAPAATGPSAPVTALIELSPTGVRGIIKVNVQDTAVPLPMARVRVQDSGEHAYCDEEGRFYLTGVETGTRTLVLTAVGYQPRTTTVDIKEGQIARVGPFILKPDTP